ncbi:SDR family oxidoreductase [Pseudomonas sp. MAFF212428]|uniref:SDR family oxidoreductase n=1 Tax=Pseudomonas brassicae TaxID=2708063 RepID=A0A6M0CUJ1_9PSED|nr:SDR family oxidoreductase [Pseudomonas brassicae]
MKRVFITGVSTGIGHALASQYLARGYAVVGVSRGCPEDLLGQPHFHFAGCDLTDIPNARPVLEQLLAQHGEQGFEVAYLNAGTFGETPTLARQTSVQAFTAVLDINLVAVKWVLDVLLNAHSRHRRCASRRQSRVCGSAPACCRTACPRPRSTPWSRSTSWKTPACSSPCWACATSTRWSRAPSWGPTRASPTWQACASGPRNRAMWSAHSNVHGRSSPCCSNAR